MPNDIEVDGLLHELFDYGPATRDHDIHFPDGTSLPPDGIATGQVASTADGVTYWVGAEAPLGNGDFDEPIGSMTELRQVQSFVKRAEDASLSFTISAAFVEASDRNAIMHRLCPPEHVYGFSCDLILARVSLAVEALRHTDEPALFDRFFHRSGVASINGYAENWDIRTFTPLDSQGPLWRTEDFDVVVEDDDGARQGLAMMTLREPQRVTIDLTGVEVGETFTVQSRAFATAYNRIGAPPSEFESSATAFLRDPQDIDGTTLEFSGLEPTAPPTGEVDDDDIEEPAPCPAPDPTAGIISFDAAEAPAVSEANRTGVATIVRTGGSEGAVTATLRSSDGTATADADYEPVATTVHFADGDTTPRTVEVPILADAIPDEVDETVVLTLSDPGGCATLGDLEQTTLTIRDDENPTPTGIGAVDASYGTAGRAATTRFGGSPSAMAVQADGKAVMTGGSFTDYRLARFDADGQLDPTFDGDGMITTDLVADNGFTTERAARSPSHPTTASSSPARPKTPAATAPSPSCATCPTAASTRLSATVVSPLASSRVTRHRWRCSPTAASSPPAG